MVHTHHRSYNQGLISADRSNKATLLLTIPRCLLSRLQRISRAQFSKLLFANQLHSLAARSMQLIRYVIPVVTFLTPPALASSQTARNPELLVASGEATRRGPSAGSGLVLCYGERLWERNRYYPLALVYLSEMERADCVKAGGRREEQQAATH